MLNRTAEEARAFIASSAFHWHQGFDLVPGVRTPGGSNTQHLIDRCNVPADLHGMSVLDIGTNNGAVCFEAERRGARRVVGVDILPITYHGFDEIRSFLGSNAAFIQGSVYDLWHHLDETFDLVFFLGVLYHLRHPLLALDAVRSLTRGVAFIETAVADHDLGELSDRPLATFYRKDELNHDASNWFTPTVRCLLDWCWSCGLAPEPLTPAARRAPRRCLVRATPTEGEPEYRTLSYELPLRPTVVMDAGRQRAPGVATPGES